MARLLYSAITSLDGYVEDAAGRFDWGEPDEEVHGFVNELERPVGTHLYGRRMYETMRVWQATPSDETVPAVSREFARIWRDADKVVYSRTLEAVSTPRTSLERRFDPVAVERLKAASGRDLSVGGAGLAGAAVASGLVDELQRLVVPVVVGGGKPWLAVTARLHLELVESRSFARGVVFLRYRPAAGGAS